jgi:hypothetical protein
VSLLASTLSLALVGCAVRVARSDLVGDWQMTGESMRLMKPPGGEGPPPRFSLLSDGSLTAENVPVTAFSDQLRWQSRYSGSGTWSLPPVRWTDGFAVVTLHFSRSGERDPTGVTLQVDKDGRGFYVFGWLGEEGGERLVFRRRL